MKYNEENNITPTSIRKSVEAIMSQTAVADIQRKEGPAYVERKKGDLAADPVIRYMDQEQLEKAIMKTRKEIEKVVKDLDFVEAARLRDEMLEMEKMRDNK